MNNRQKLGYMALGATILAVGITIGQFVTPNIEAQNNGVFDKIVCRELEVVDRQGNTAIRAAGTPERGFLSIFGRRGYSRMTGESIAIYDLLHDRDAILIASWEDANLIKVYDKCGRDAIGLSSFKGFDVRGIASVIGIRPLSNENSGDTPAVHGWTQPRAITDWAICGYERN